MLHSPQYMHIPDGYLSPATCLVLILLTLPFWNRGIQKMRQTLNARAATGRSEGSLNSLASLFDSLPKK